MPFRRSSLVGVLAVSCVTTTVLAGGGGRPLHENLASTLLPLYRELMNDGTGDVVLIGDSLTINQNTYTYALNEKMWSSYGIAGDGFRGVGAGFTGGMRDGVAIIAAPNTVRSTNSGQRQLPMGAYTIGGNFATLYPPNGALIYQVYGPAIRVHYVTQPGGGRFVVSPEGGQSLEVETDGDLGVGYVDVLISGQGSKTRQLRIDTAFASAGPIMISSLEMRSGHRGYIQHYAGRGGVGPEDFLRADEGSFTQVLGTLDPELVLVMLDYVGGAQPQTFEPDMNALLDRIEAGVPDSKIVLVTHHPFVPGIFEEANTYLDLSRQRGYGYINLYDLFEGYEEMDALGYMADQVHLTEAGGEFFGAYIYDLFERYGRSAVIADPTGDESWDFSDVSAFLVLFAAQDKDADLAPPYGVWDFNDVVEFLYAFSLVTE